MRRKHTERGAGHWIAERITPVDVCVTADIPLASCCLEKGALALAPSGKRWTGDNIGSADRRGTDRQCAERGDCHELRERVYGHNSILQDYAVLANRMGRADPP